MSKGKTILLFIAGMCIVLDIWLLSNQAEKDWAVWYVMFIWQPLAEAFVDTLLFGDTTSLTELAGQAGFFMMNFAVGVLFIRLCLSRFRDIALRELIDMTM